jgi:hypothetical protein
MVRLAVMRDETDCTKWAAGEFGHVELGNFRRRARLVRMAAAACERPSGKVAAVFTSDRDREGAYDFLESEHVSAEEIIEGLATATAGRSKEQPFVFVPLDGTSITVTDRTGESDFGRIGADAQRVRGLKVVDALAVDPQGTPIGLLALTWWARGERSPARDTTARQARPVEQKETHYWMQTIRAAASALTHAGVRGWFQIDREGDGCDVLQELEQTGHGWTVRGNADRSIQLEDGDADRLRAELSRQTVAGGYRLPVIARPGRKPRQAHMIVRVARVVLRLRDRRTSRITRLAVHAVWAREQDTTPAGEDPIDWLLYTNRPVDTLDEAFDVVWGYAQRWKVEEFHRTWKRGDCDVESTQLGSFAAVQRWATILAAVAVRIERLKRLSRVQPHAPAALELSPFEIRALKTLKFGSASPPDGEPTMGQAVLWLAELGGYANKYSGKPPGATVLGRGLKYLRPAARLLEIQHV